MFSLNRGIEYLILFKNKLDYFDYVPDLEKNLKIKIDFNGDFVVYLSTKQTDERLKQCEYYISRKDQWFKEVDFHNYRSEKLANNVLQMTELEKENLNHILEKFNDQVLDHGWHDICKVMC